MSYHSAFPFTSSATSGRKLSTPKTEAKSSCGLNVKSEYPFRLLRGLLSKKSFSSASPVMENDRYGFSRTTGSLRSAHPGCGAGSKLLAWTFAERGQRVAVIERKYVGGACPNIACLPSKNIIHTAQIAHNVRHPSLNRRSSTRASSEAATPACNLVWLRNLRNYL